jgi:serine/threonine-protein kinase
MGASSVPALVDAIKQHRLLRSTQLNELTGKLQDRFPNVKDLGKHLLKLGWLTPYQLNQLMNDGGELRIGPYHLLERIGEGGMGQVFKARHERLDRIVALKVIRKDSRLDPQAIQRFEREARAAAQLSHPNIVTLYDADQVGNNYFLAMEYVDGTDLARRVQQHGPLPVGEACEYIRQAAIGLHHAHERGLIHRDIKPHNLLVTRAEGSSGVGVVKILDMGLARLSSAGSGDDPGKRLTQLGTVVGTPEFMSPEQANDASAIDGRADLYGLGCTFWFLLTGKPPFCQGTSMEILLQHTLEQPAAIDKLRPDVPPELGRIVARLLAKRPKDRFATGADLAGALAPWCQTGAGSVPRVAARRNKRRLIVLAGLLLIAGLSLAGMGMLSSLGTNPAPSTPAGPTRASTPSTPRAWPYPSATDDRPQWKGWDGRPPDWHKGGGSDWPKGKGKPGGGGPRN